MLQRNFENLSFREKVELYLIVIILLFLCSFFVYNFNSQKTLQTHQESQHLTIKSLSSKILKEDPPAIINYVETQIAKHNLFVETFQTSDHLISITLSGEFDSLLRFFHLLEAHLIVEEFSFEKKAQDNRSIQASVHFSHSYFLVENFQLPIVSKGKNPFEYRKEKIPKKPKKEPVEELPIHIEAIVKEEVLIKGDWYKKGDIFKNSTIVNIAYNQIEILHNTTKKITTIRIKQNE